jgi:hypothetical protein
MFYLKPDSSLSPIMTQPQLGQVEKLKLVFSHFVLSIIFWLV